MKAGLALVIGAGGGLGAALVAGLRQPGPQAQAATGPRSPSAAWSSTRPSWRTASSTPSARPGGPASPLLARTGPCVAGFISAKVGSIGDNALGGWYGYRASKAALNQIVRTAAIELARRNRQAVCVALHPGTVDTPLSQPFAKAGLNVRSPSGAAGDLPAVLDGTDARAKRRVLRLPRAGTALVSRMGAAAAASCLHPAPGRRRAGESSGADNRG